MKNLVWGFLCLILFYGCKKESGCGYNEHNIVAPLSEQQLVKDYLTSINVYAASKDSSGFYYEVLQDGEGDSPNLCSQIELSYTGKLTSGNVFEQKNAAFTLGSSIEGLRKGIPIISKGGRIKLYIPPTLAYGSREVKDDAGKVIIPANSILIFDIQLTAFY
ncbi:FKBP-type peptidyl-prolyl cis-trans isomerase [Longitalea luteola]|uniref:FKBP-type peptidyl-prolyl cis-trans isomerase n=1 Tax=Longitalea luteola TaxID=2812563 RepID=UPI001A96FDDD|nr:FKBP-type peptidyl-prolyl cis-trans isomerase [Longitalea luteola]